MGRDFHEGNSEWSSLSWYFSHSEAVGEPRTQAQAEGVEGPKLQLGQTLDSLGCLGGSTTYRVAESSKGGWGVVGPRWNPDFPHLEGLGGQDCDVGRLDNPGCWGRFTTSRVDPQNSRKGMRELDLGWETQTHLKHV